MKFNTPFVATPGPTQIPLEIFKAMNVNMHHRTEEFESILKKCSEKTAIFFGASNPVLFVSGSGTALMEGAITNTISPKDKIIVIEFGKFSERFRHIAEAFDCTIVRLTAPLGQYPDPNELETLLSQHPDTKAVFTCHCETSTGALAPIKEYAKIIYPTDSIFIVDCISSIVSSPINQDLSKIDLCFATGGKGLMLPPGLGFFSLSGSKINDRLLNSRIPKFYMNIHRELILQQQGKTAWTPNIQHVLGLQKSLEILLSRKIDKLYESYRNTAIYAQKRIESWGLNSVVPNGFKASPSVIGYYTNNASEVIKKMSQKGITIANGQDELHNKIFRIGNMGMMDLEIMTFILDHLEDTLEIK